MIYQLADVKRDRSAWNSIF